MSSSPAVLAVEMSWVASKACQCLLLVNAVTAQDRLANNVTKGSPLLLHRFLHRPAGRRQQNLPCCAASLQASAMSGSSSLNSPSRLGFAPWAAWPVWCGLRLALTSEAAASELGGGGSCGGVYCTVLSTTSCSAHLRLQHSFIYLTVYTCLYILHTVL
jgi:hypothetical protein